MIKELTKAWYVSGSDKILKNEEIIKNITDLVNPNENDLIIEIGPGRGALTKYLIKKNCDLVCIEIDTDLKFYLDKYQSKKCKIRFSYKIINRPSP